jgi:hypothetical protein
METYYVGGKHFFNRFSNLEAAVDRASDDDVIELCKDVEDVSVIVKKNIIIRGNGHHITPAPDKAAIVASSFITLEDICFLCRPRTNAVVMHNGGKLSNITTKIVGPVKLLYPSVVQRGGEVTIEDSDIMQIEVYENNGNPTTTIINKCRIRDYYKGDAYLMNIDYNLSKLSGVTKITNSVIECMLFKGTATIVNTQLLNYNKVSGNATLNSCRLSASKNALTGYEDEPKDGPLKDYCANVIPFALQVAGGSVISEGHVADSQPNCFGFYVTSGSLEIRNTATDNDQVHHLIKGGSVVFNDVVDNAFYEIRTVRYSIIRSTVNTSITVKTAMDELNEMIGLGAVKSQLRTIVNTIKMNMKCPEKDFGFSHHMVFAGDPGTGKTTVAKLVARALYEIGVIPENKCMEVPASQMIKGYVGQTGEHVESILQNALGGVLFIDEAYELMVKDNQNTYNNDALAVLLRYMEDHRSELVVIAAGYEKEMKEFLASNVGLMRRFQWVSFEDYTPSEMADIFISMSKRYGETFQINDPHGLLVDCFTQLTGYYLSHPDAKGRVTNGGNGGLVRNLFQQVIFARNNRVAETNETMMQIIFDDIQHGFNEEMNKAQNVTFAGF